MIKHGSGDQIWVQNGQSKTTINQNYHFIAQFRPTPDGGYEQRFVRMSMLFIYLASHQVSALDWHRLVSLEKQCSISEGLRHQQT